LFATSSGKIVAYTIGNDVSSRSIEGENPLYLPQAKTFDKCACLGPGLYIPECPIPRDAKVSIKITRHGEEKFCGETLISQMKRTPDELIEYLFRECSFTNGVFLMTGTGIVPEKNFSLRSGDVVAISIDFIGTLINSVE
jgi:2-dehydro-3-deoxy-D-arabinonate dehydratase